MDILKEKHFPYNFPNDVLDIIGVLAFDMNTVQVMGSQNLSSQLYAADYDLYEEVKEDLKHSGLALQKIVSRFQQKIKYLTESMPNVYITDIKAGLLPELQIIPDSAYVVQNRIENFDKEKSLFNLENAYSHWGALSKQEYLDFKNRIESIQSPTDFLILKKDLRLHIIRWTPASVARNLQQTPNGPMSLQYAFCCPTIVKVDLVAWLESANKYVEFSIIYKFQNGRHVFNNFTMDAQREIRQNLLYLIAENNWFKAAKRMFSLARLNDWSRDLESLNTILNSDLGILYSLVSDAETVLFLLENESFVPITKIRYCLEGFRNRLGNVYSIDANKKSILRSILNMESLPGTKKGKVELYDSMVRLIEFFSVLLNRHCEERLQSVGLIPLDQKYKPA